MLMGVWALHRLPQSRNKTVGSKQTLKAIEKDQALAVYIARDAERRVVEPIIGACRERHVPVVEVESMRALGKLCGIDVGCACASLLKDKA